MSKPHLYILSEGEGDELIYEGIAEKVTGLSYDKSTDQRFVYRKGENFKIVQSKAKILLEIMAKWQGDQDNIRAIIAIDNDRAPNHPASGPKPERTLPSFDLKKTPRHQALKSLVDHAYGNDPSGRSVKIALAVPVEMIESWVLHLLDPQRERLPLFAEASQMLTQRYYQGSQVPLQLKDLCQGEVHRRNLSSFKELCLVATEGDLAAAEVVSPSLKLFCDELRAWD